jgi:uncharacterized membrane protein
LLLAFYVVGCMVSYNYDARHLSAVDRLAFVVYLFCVIWPAFAVRNNLAAVTPTLLWSTGIGMAVLVVSFALHRAYCRRMFPRNERG